MVKELRFGEAARQESLSGVNALARAKQSTSGPRGRIVVLDRSHPAPMIPPSEEMSGRVIALRGPFGAGLTFFENTTPHTLPTPLNNADKLGNGPCVFPVAKK